jgi:hypothetical protein
MNPHPKTFTRRSFLSFGATAMVLPLFGYLPRINRGRSARLKMTYRGNTLGVKFSENRQGQIIVTLRQLGGDQLLAINMGTPKDQGGKEQFTANIKAENGNNFRIRMDNKANISSSLSGVRFDQIDYQPGDSRPGNNKPSGEGFFSWLGNLVHDALVVLGAGLAWLNGTGASFKFSWGGKLDIYRNGDIGYRASKFKLEPGMEEDPLIWY